MRFKRIVHLSENSRAQGHPGGVEKFGHYLAAAIGCEVVTPGDRPDLDDPSCLYICDAHWRLEVSERCTAVAMMHGCAAERGHNRGKGRLQAKLTGVPNTYFVGNSDQTIALCKQYYDLDIPDKIWLAVDEDRYAPPIETARPIALTATAGKGHKGHRRLKKLAKRLDGIDFHNLDCGLDEEFAEFRRTDVFVHLSKHEGFAYSVLEAMAANAAVVVTPHGIAYELQHLDIPGIYIVPEAEMNNLTRVAELVQRAVREPRETRAWVKEQCSIERFNRSWQTYIDRIQRGEVLPGSGEPVLG